MHRAAAARWAIADGTVARHVQPCCDGALLSICAATWDRT